MISHLEKKTNVPLGMSSAPNRKPVKAVPSRKPSMKTIVPTASPTMQPTDGPPKINYYNMTLSSDTKYVNNVDKYVILINDKFLGSIYLKFFSCIL